MNDLTFGATLAACLIGLCAAFAFELTRGPAATAPARIETSAAPASAAERRIAVAAQAPAAAR